MADYLCGDYALPRRRRCVADIARDQAAMRKRYVASKRHTIQVDFDDYLLRARTGSVGPGPSGPRRRAFVLPSRRRSPTRPCAR